jgi:hypothetical protein
MNHLNHKGRLRRGLSLLEVIMCTVVVALMLVPIVDLIRVSNRTLVRVEKGSTTAQRLQQASIWLRDTLRDSQIQSVVRNNIQLRLANGDVATLQTNNTQLILNTKSHSTIVCDDITGASWRELLTTTPPFTRTGVVLAIQANDPVKGPIEIETTVAVGP